MSTYRDTESSTTYKEVLQATELIQPPAVGFLSPASYSTIASAVNQGIKQNNTIIQYLAVLDNKIDELEAQLSRLQQKSPRQQLPAAAELKELTEQLRGLNISSDKLPVRKPKLSGPLYVYKNPQEIFEEEKKRIIGVSKSSPKKTATTKTDKASTSTNEEKQQ